VEWVLPEAWEWKELVSGVRAGGVTDKNDLKDWANGMLSEWWSLVRSVTVLARENKERPEMVQWMKAIKANPPAPGAGITLFKLPPPTKDHPAKAQPKRKEDFGCPFAPPPPPPTQKLIPPPKGLLLYFKQKPAKLGTMRLRSAEKECSRAFSLPFPEPNFIRSFAFLPYHSAALGAR